MIQSIRKLVSISSDVWGIVGEIEDDCYNQSVEKSDTSPENYSVP